MESNICMRRQANITVYLGNIIIVRRASQVRSGKMVNSCRWAATAFLISIEKRGKGGRRKIRKFFPKVRRVSETKIIENFNNLGPDCKKEIGFSNFPAVLQFFSLRFFSFSFPFSSLFPLSLRCVTNDIKRYIYQTVSKNRASIPIYYFLHGRGTNNNTNHVTRLERNRYKQLA